MPEMELSRRSLRRTRTGDEERVSTPVNTAASSAKPLILLSNKGIASLREFTAKSGKQFLRSHHVTPVGQVGIILFPFCEGMPLKKSPTVCAGAL